MRLKLAYSLLFLGIMASPSMASAKGGVLSDTVGTVAKTVSAVEEKVPAPDKQQSGDEQNAKESDQKKADHPSLVQAASQTVDHIADTAGKLTEPVDKAAKPVESVTKTVENTTKTIGNVTKAVEKPVEQLTKQPVKQVTKNVDTVTQPVKSVVKTVGSVTKTVAEPVSKTVAKPVKEVTDTVDETIHKVINKKTDQSAIEVKAEADTGNNEVSADVGDKNAAVETSEQEIGKKEHAVKYREHLLSKPLMDEKWQQTSGKNSANTHRLSKMDDPAAPMPSKQNNNSRSTSVQAIVPTNSQGGSATGSAPSSGSAQTVSFAAILGSDVDIDVHYSNPQLDKSKNYYDQWLNAPPAQPPKSSSSLNV
ncbi:hypothetical protein [Falsibacillus albus]|uniref:Uncharacterized protein n=1 Tax=Falsibacillus albus TaxID=2478915 RepID=A0A3L7JQN1_9BACI|nr:hypothetical protein [Falsibacillus albus]RLQ93127.1 hypothetical protein D9X91_19045 [Falsibacillus albus]